MILVANPTHSDGHITSINLLSVQNNNKPQKKRESTTNRLFVQDVVYTIQHTYIIELFSIAVHGAGELVCVRSAIHWYGKHKSHILYMSVSAEIDRTNLSNVCLMRVRRVDGNQKSEGKKRTLDGWKNGQFSCLKRKLARQCVHLANTIFLE